MYRQTLLYGEHSQEVGKLFEDLSKAQGEIANAPRTKKSHYGMYADLATVRDTARTVCSKYGLCITQPPVPYSEGGDHAVITILGHKSGQWIKSAITIKGGQTPQQFASSVTYARRAAYAAILGLAADDDDDGEAAEEGHATASVNKAVELEKRAEEKIKANKTKPEEVKKILDHVEILVEQGDMRPSQAKSLRDRFGALANPKQKEVAVAQ
jgi:hypothetical protein